MSEINKIPSSSTSNYDVQSTQATPQRRRDKRETTVTNQDASSSQQEQSSEGKEKNQPKTRKSQAMDDMLEALRQQQNIEDDTLDYNTRLKDLHRQRVRQDSVDYIKNLEKTRESQSKKHVAEQDVKQDAHKVYHSRIQDISRSHINKILKHRIDEKTFESVKNINPQDAEDAKDQGKFAKIKTGSQSESPAQKMDASRLRPELTDMLSKMRGEGKAETATPQQKADAPQQKADAPGKSLLDGAIAKLKQRLGGPEQAPPGSLDDAAEFKPVLDKETVPRPIQKENMMLRKAPAPIRANVDDIKASIERSRTLKASADGKQYVPLQDSDVQRLLIENKLPVSYELVQAIKLASQGLQDSSRIFMKAAVLLKQIGMDIDLKTMDVVTESLRMFEKYGRNSTMNKLYRYLVTTRFMQVNERLAQYERRKAQGRPLNLLQSYQTAQLSQNLSQEQIDRMKRVQANAEIKGMNLPADANKTALQSAIKHMLKELGLPNNKVIARQLVESSYQNSTRAQALVMQLAAGRSLKSEAVDQLLQRMMQLSPEDRRLPLVELMQKLALPVPKSADKGLQAAQAELKNMLKTLGFTPGQMEANPLTREALLVLKQMGERLDIFQKMLPELAQQVRSNPELWMKKLAGQLGNLKQTLLQMPEGKVTPEQAANFQKNLLLALDLPPDRTRTWSRVMNALNATATQQSATQASTPGTHSAPGQVANQAPGQPSGQTAAGPGQSPAANSSAQSAGQQAPAPSANATQQPTGQPAPAPSANAAQSAGQQAPAPSANAAQHTTSQQAPAPSANAAQHTTSQQAPAPSANAAQHTAGQQASAPSANLTQHTAGQPAPAPSANVAQHTTGQPAPTPSANAAQHTTSQPAPAPSANAAQHTAGQQAPTPSANLTQHTAGQPAPAPSANLTQQSAASPGTVQSALVSDAPSALNPEQILNLVKGGDVPTMIAQARSLGYALPAESQQLPLAAESILLLHLQAERQDVSQALLPRMNQLLQAAPLQTLQQLETLLPALQQSGQLKPGELAEALNLLQRAALSQHQPPATAPAAEGARAQSVGAQAPHTLPTQALELSLHRLFPEMAAEQRSAIVQNLSQASPASMEGVFQLNKLLGLMDPSRLKVLEHTLSNPKIVQQFESLGKILKPVLNMVDLRPENRFFLSASFQNQLIQNLQNMLLYKSASPFKSSLKQWLKAENRPEVSLGKLRDYLAEFGVKIESQSLLAEVWQLSGGSRERMDAMGLLLRGGFPLLQQNIASVLQYIQQLPPQWRRQSIGDILMHLSPKLISTIQSQIQAQHPMGQLLALLQNDLPLLPENLARVPSQPPLPGMQVSLNQLLTSLQDLQAAMPQQQLPEAGQKLQSLVQTLQQSLTRWVNGGALDLPKLLQTIQSTLHMILSAPSSGAATAQSSAQAPTIQSWVQLMSQALGTAPAPELLQKFESQLTGLLMQLQELLPRLSERTSRLPLLSAPNPQAIAQQSEIPQDIQKYLQQWGLNIQSPEMLQQIQGLMQGSMDRLDAMAMLLQGNHALIPAHISIVAEYVKRLPRNERFQSISKILLFLSDALIQKMQSELESRQQGQYQQLMPELSEEDQPEALRLLRQRGGPLTENGLETTRMLFQSKLPKDLAHHKALQHVLNDKHRPQSWLGPVQQLLGQYLSLLPRQIGVTPQLETLYDTLAALQQQLKPSSSQLNHWMLSVGANLKQLSTELRQQVSQLHQSLVGQDEDSWIDALLNTLLGLADWLEEEEPEKAQQAKMLRQHAREQLQQMRHSFESLGMFHQSEAPGLSAQQSDVLSQYIPAMIQQMGYPVEILLQAEKDDPEAPGEKQTQVDLVVQTHTLGEMYLSLSTRRKGLTIEVGVENATVRQFLQPYLESLRQKLEPFPWEIAPVKTYVLQTQLQRRPVIAQHYYKRYGRSAVAGV